MSKLKYLFSLSILLVVFMTSIFVGFYTLDTGDAKGYLIIAIGALVFGYEFRKMADFKYV